MGDAGTIQSQQEIEDSWGELMPYEPRGGGVPGVIRRVRRILDVSQRGLAELLGVSQSRVARWERARTSPDAEMLIRLVRMAGLSVTLVDDEGEGMPPMRDDGAMDRAARRFPAHVDLRATSWWAPRNAATWAELPLIFAQSRELGRPQIRFYRDPYLRRVQREITGTPVDHPSRLQLAAEVESCREQRRLRHQQRAIQARTSLSP